MINLNLIIMKLNHLQKTMRSKVGISYNVCVLGLLLAGINTVSLAQQELEGVIVEKISVTDEALENDPNLPADAIAYRVFIDMTPEMEIQAVYADLNAQAVFSTTTKFYNNADFGGTTGKEIYTSLINGDPALAFDSYVTLNAATNNRLGILYDEDVNDGVVDGLVNGSSLSLQTIGLDFSIPFGTEDYFGTFAFNDALYLVNGGEQGPTAENRVLIGQFTTDGEFSFEINIQIREKDGDNVLQFVARKAVGLQYQHPGLHYPPPRIQLMSPTQGEKVPIGEDIELVTSVWNIFGIRRVEFFANDSFVGNDTIAPYQLGWKTTEGEVRLMAVVIDSLGASDTTDIVEITVADVVAPVVSITSPAPLSHYNQNENISILADASDTDGSITLVEFFVNDSKIGEDNTAPYQVNWTPIVPGDYTLHALATDNDGAKTTSADIMVTIDQVSAFNDKYHAEDFIFFPVPVENKLVFRLNALQANTNYQLEIIDITGKVQLNENLKTSGSSGYMEIDVAYLPKGIYQVRLFSDKGNYQQSKFIK